MRQTAVIVSRVEVNGLHDPSKIRTALNAVVSHARGSQSGQPYGRQQRDGHNGDEHVGPCESNLGVIPDPSCPHDPVYLPGTISSVPKTRFHRRPVSGYGAINLTQTGAPTSDIVPVGWSRPVAESMLNSTILSEP
jgi:hypothetical protein